MPYAEEKTSDIEDVNHGASVTDDSVQSASNHPDQKTDAVSETGSQVDDAWKFLSENRLAAEREPTVDINALRRRIDWHIVPLMFFCYTLQFLDKVILNVSSAITLSREDMCTDWF